MRRGGVPDSGMIFFRLTSLELGLLFFAVILGATGLGIFLGRRVRHLSETLKEPFGVLQAALLGLVGAAARVRSVAGGLPLRGSPLEHRHRGQRDRHDIPPRPDPAGADPQPLAGPARPLHAERRPPLGRGAGQRRGRGRPRTGGADSAPAVEPRGRGSRHGADRQRATPLRRDAQRDDRRGDRTRRRPQQPGPNRRPGARGTRLRPRPRAARGLPGDRRKGRARGLARVGARRVPAPRNRGPRSSDPGNDPGPRHRAEEPTRVDDRTARRCCAGTGGEYAHPVATPDSPMLSESQLATLAELGEERTANVGDVLYRVGDQELPVHRDPRG